MSVKILIFGDKVINTYMSVEFKHSTDVGSQWKKL